MDTERRPRSGAVAMKECDNARIRSDRLAFAAFSGLRTISYVPQIARIARDRDGV